MAFYPIGCGQLTWPRDLSDDQVLSEIAQAGYDGAPAAPHPGRTAQSTIDQYARFGLKPAPGYLGADFWKPELHDRLLEQARQYARFMREVGCTEVYVAAGGFDYVTPSGKTRSQRAGQITEADAMTDAEFKQFGRTLNEIGEIALAEGVQICFHNHVGSTIETRAEFERLLALTDPGLVFLGPDTGHLAWAGDDAVQFCRDYAARIKTIHLKDINLDVAVQGRAEGWDYGGFVKRGIWTELGQGAIDFAAILAALREAGFKSWMIVETDVTGRPTALESAVVSREYLKSIGL
jgi:inosose dehydratase